MLPDGCDAVGYGNSFSTDSALTDLPEPDSPTRATHSPRLISHEMRSTASEVLPCWRKATERSRMLSSGWLTASIRTAPAPIEPGVHLLAQFAPFQSEAAGHGQTR